jgi:hypothetical protein
MDFHEVDRLWFWKNKNQKLKKSGRIRGREDGNAGPFAVLEKSTKLVNWAWDNASEDVDFEWVEEWGKGESSLAAWC